jgi:E1A/CREB-binding protein
MISCISNALFFLAFSDLHINVTPISFSVQLLRQRKPNAPQEWLEKLPAMAKRLEESLYRSAPSFDAYNDINTLKQRLQQLAMTIGTKTRRMQQQQAAQQQQVQQQQVQQQQVQQQQPLAQPQQQYRPPPTQQQQVVQRAPQPNNVQPMPAQPGVPLQQHPMHMQQQMNSNIQPAPAVAQANYQQAPAPAAPAPPQPAAPAPARQPSDRQQVLRHQQQRLLLLRHAAKCPHQDNQCPVTPHCAGMKRLWKHIAECKDQKCMVPHCVSSRYVLSHYHRCKDVRCPVCGPVREAIHRSHEKQKQMQALKQGHQQALQQNQLPAGSAVAQQPPTKRQKTNGQYSSTQVPYQQQQQQQQQQVRPVAPNPNVQGGYVYNKPPPSTSAPPGAPHSGGKVLAMTHDGPKPQEDHTLINCFTLEQIETHIKSLNQGLQLAVPKLKSKCGEVLKGLQSHAHGWVFNSPVDPVELNLPDYFEVIEKPMDLGTVKKKLENGVYRNLSEVEADINLTFDNAMLYNPEGSVVSNMAKELKDKFAQDWSVLMTQLHAEEEEKRKNGDACSLCGCEKLLFEPPVFYCNGLTCRSKRIRRNSYFFVGGNNQYHWCQPCYDDLKESKPIQLADITLKKSQLDKKKNNEVPEESWVQCDRCERWIHQICALFNTRQNKDQRSEFVCASCTVVERKQKNAPEPTSTTPMAEDLPRTKLSEHLEKHIREKLKERQDSEVQAKMAENEVRLLFVFNFVFSSRKGVSN